MSYWSWWTIGISLALIMALHYLLTGRLMAVSGRFTALVNRLRFGPEQAPSEMSQEELLLAMQAATAEEFGNEALEAPPAALSEVGCGVSMAAPAEVSLSKPRGTANHVAFFAALLIGGLVAALIDGRFKLDATLASVGLTSFAGALSPLVLLGGGVLVGFGTRMAGGCTSGHGLCGVSRVQPGSLAATAAFFAAGIATATLVGLL
jgi:uncharacterized membrane protein YedE/YeeE